MDSRTKRQYASLDKWEKNDYNGCIIATTGYGKTYTSILGIQGMIKRKNIKSVTIIVPTKDLKSQWEEELELFNITIAQVFVVNTAARYWDTIGCDLLIIDEYHTVASPYFRKVLDIQYKYILTLTATITRSDGLHELLLEHTPIVDEITLQECLDNKWVSEFIIYNIPVPLSPEELVKYKSIDAKFKNVASRVGGMKNANLMLKSNNPKEVGTAANYYKYIRLRKDVCRDNENKIPIVKRIVNCFPDRYGLIFNPSIKFSKQVELEIGDSCRSYNSKLSKTVRADIITSFKDESQDLRLLSTVSALDAGFNHPKSSLGIITAGNSSQLTNIQRTGRLVRKHPDKQAIIVNLYSPDTQEVAWLNTRLNGMKVYNLKNIEDFEIIYNT